MSVIQILQWIKDNLSADIQAALAKVPGTIFTEADLAGINCRETGGLLARYAFIKPSVPVANICSLMRGDYSARPGEIEKTYHGYGLTQIDIASFPDFVKSGAWKIPLKCYAKSLQILEAKKNYILSKYPGLEPESLKHATLSAYNCGEGNVVKALAKGLDSDSYTTGHNYASAVEEFSENYSNLVEK